MHVEPGAYYLEESATEYIPQKHIKLLRAYQPDTTGRSSGLRRGKELLQVATLSGGRYVLARLIECGYTFYALPAEDVELIPDHDRSSVNFNCL